MITVTQKRRYAHAVLSGEFKKDAYLRHVNSDTTNPSSAAWRLEHTKSMPTIFSEARSELDRAKELEERCHAALEGSLCLVERLNADTTTLSPQEAIKALSQTTRLLTVLEKQNRRNEDARQIVEDDEWDSKARNWRPSEDFLDGVIL